VIAVKAVWEVVYIGPDLNYEWSCFCRSGHISHLSKQRHLALNAYMLNKALYICMGKELCMCCLKFYLTFV